MNIDKIKSVFKERWKFYLIGYMLGYAVPLILYGVPNCNYLFPLKIMGIAGVLFVGNTFYHGSRKMTVLQGLQKSVKYGGIFIILILLALGIKELIQGLTGFDITPYIGIPKSTK